ncbi:MAG TPA: hypothetical protein VMV97_13840 [Sulfuriferula sp.]|nr:hypothetical protein [Sulfuriferula sp.]
MFATSGLPAGSTIQMLKLHIRAAFTLQNAAKVLDYGRAGQFGQARQAPELVGKAMDLWRETPDF